MVKKTVIFMVLCTVTACAYAQDAVYSQFYTAQLVLNPAYAGIVNGPRFQLNYRNQWPNIQGGYTTYSAAYDQYFDALHSGIGLVVMSDNMANGFYTTTSAYGCYSYTVTLSPKHAINFGAQAGFFEHSLNLNSAVFLDQIDPNLATNGGIPATTEYLPASNTLTRFDVGAGIVYFSDKTYFGASFQHLTTPNESFIGQDSKAVLPLKMSVNLGYEFRKVKNIHKTRYFGPNFLYINQGSFQQYNLGAYYGVNKIMFGMWYRGTPSNGDALIFTLGFHTNMLKIGYSYDAGVSALAKYTGGANELSLSYNFAEGKKMKQKLNRSRIRDCPLIF